MRPVLRYSLLGAGCYLLFLLVMFPASQAYRFAATPLKEAVPQLQLGGIEGAIWSGRIESLLYRKALLGKMSWHLSPLPLLLGRAQLDALLQSQGGYLQSRVTVPLAGGNIALADIQGQLPVSELLRFSPYLPIVLDGTLSLDLAELQMAANGRLLKAEGTVVWHQAAMSAPQALEFGDLKMVLHPEADGAVKGDISDLGGPLKVAGTLELKSDGSYRLDATVAAAAKAPTTLVNALGLLGQPDAQKRYRLNYQGHM